MNETLQHIWQLFAQSLGVFAQKFMELVPSILGGIAVIFVAWLLARLVAGGFERLLQIVRFDVLAERLKITNFLDSMGVEASPSAIIGRFIYWIFVLLIVASAAETLQWTAFSLQIQKFLNYLPNLVSASFVFAVGAYLAAVARDFLRRSMTSFGISTGRILSSIAYYLLFIMVVLTALQQAQIDTWILSANMLIIVGAVMLAAAISYGFASREVLANILAGFFNKRTFQKGMIIEIDGIRGTIVSITNVAVVLQTADNEQVVVPSQQLMSAKVKIIQDFN